MNVIYVNAEPCAARALKHGSLRISWWLGNSLVSLYLKFMTKHPEQLLAWDGTWGPKLITWGSSSGKTVDLILLACFSHRVGLSCTSHLVFDMLRRLFIYIPQVPKSQLQEVRWIHMDIHMSQWFLWLSWLSIPIKPPKTNQISEVLLPSLGLLTCHLWPVEPRCPSFGMNVFWPRTFDNNGNLLTPCRIHFNMLMLYTLLMFFVIVA